MLIWSDCHMSFSKNIKLSIAKKRENAQRIFMKIRLENIYGKLITMKCSLSVNPKTRNSKTGIWNPESSFYETRQKKFASAMSN